MKTLKLTITILMLGTTMFIFGQEQTFDCTCGVLIGNARNPDRPLTIAYSNTFTAKCKKRKNLYLDNGVKEQIMLQFFNKLMKDYPSYLEPFKGTTNSAVQVWVVESESEFENRIHSYFGTKYDSYNILKDDKFEYDPSLLVSGTTSFRTERDKKIKYLRKN